MAVNIPGLDFTAIDQFLNNATSTLEGINNSLSSGTPLSSFGTQAAIANANSTITSVNSSLSDGFNQLVNSVTSAIGNEVNSIQNTITAIGNGVNSTVGQLYNSVSTLFEDLKNGITTEAQRTLQLLTAGWQDLQTSFSNGFNFVVSDLQNGLTGIGTDISNGISQAIATISQPLEYIGQTIANGIESSVNEVASLVNAIPQTLENVVKTVASGIGDAVTGLEGIGKAISGLVDPQQIFKAIAMLPGTLVDDLGKTFGDLSRPIADNLLKAAGLETNYLTGDDYRKLTEVAAAEAVVGALATASPSLGFILQKFVNNIADAVLAGAYRNLTYSGDASVPNKIVDAATAIKFYFRGIYNEQDLKGVLLKQGLSDATADDMVTGSYNLLGLSDLIGARFRGVLESDDLLYLEAGKIGYVRTQVDRLMNIMRPLLGPGQAIEMWRRDVQIAGDADYFDDLRRAGWTDARITAIKNISYRLPDLEMYKDFIIKDLFNAETIAKYGLDKGMNDAYFAVAKKLGWDEDTAKLVYYATWEYPPFFILESMYKSGEIDEATFRQLLVFEGTPEFFIDAFVKQLAPKLTQADVKDMYKYQVITADEIPAKLATIGITGSLASDLQHLWIASVKLASPLDQTATATKTAAVKQLSQSTVLTAYANGEINESQALDYLEKAKYDADEANLIIQNEKYKIVQKAITDGFAAIKDDLGVGLIDFNSAVQKTQALNPTPLQYEKFYDELYKTTVHKPRLPTEAQLTAWLKKGIIAATDFVGQMRLLGFQDQYINAFLLENGVAQADATKALSS